MCEEGEFTCEKADVNLNFPSTSLKRQPRVNVCDSRRKMILHAWKKQLLGEKKKERVIVIIFSTIISISQCPAMMALCESVGVSIWFILNRSSNTSTHFEMHLANAPYNASEWLALFYVITCNLGKDHFSWSMRSFLCVPSCHGCGKKKEYFFWCNQ